MNLKKSPITGNYSVIADFFKLPDGRLCSVCTETGYVNIGVADILDAASKTHSVTDSDGNIWKPMYLTDDTHELRLVCGKRGNNWEVLKWGEVFMEVPEEEFQKGFQEYMSLIEDFNK